VNSTNLQIDTFLDNDSFREGDVVAMLIGVNGILFNTSITAQASLYYLGRQSLRLYNATVSTVVLGNYPDLTTIPEVQHLLEPAAHANVTTWTRGFAAGLNMLAAAFRPLLNVAVMDIYSLSQEIALVPEIYGSNASYAWPHNVPCLTGTYANSGPESCARIRPTMSILTLLTRPRPSTTLSQDSLLLPRGWAAMGVNRARSACTQSLARAIQA
jgi:hypothetical protein